MATGPNQQKVESYYWKINKIYRILKLYFAAFSTQKFILSKKTVRVMVMSDELVSTTNVTSVTATNVTSVSTTNMSYPMMETSSMVSVECPTRRGDRLRPIQ